MEKEERKIKVDAEMEMEEKEWIDMEWDLEEKENGDVEEGKERDGDEEKQLDNSCNSSAFLVAFVKMILSCCLLVET